MRSTAIPREIMVLMNHIYELNKGVRQMVLFTCNKKYGKQTVERLESQGIPYILQPAGQQNLNIYFGRCHPPDSYTPPQPANTRRRLHPRCHARLRHLRTVRALLPPQRTVRRQMRWIVPMHQQELITSLDKPLKNEHNNCHLWFLNRNLRGHRRKDCLKTRL